MANATVAVDGLETLEVALQFPAQVTFNHDIQGTDRVDDGIQLFRREVFGADVGIDVGDFQHTLGVAGTDTIDVGQGRFDAFVTGNFYSKKAWHIFVLGLGG